MQSMQKKILDKIEEIITAGGLEAVQRAQYANTGRITAMRDFETVWWVDYNFQDESLGLDFGGPATEAFQQEYDVRGFGAGPGVASRRTFGFHLRYEDSEKVANMLRLLTTLCPSVDKPVENPERCGLALTFAGEAIGAAGINAVNSLTNGYTVALLEPGMSLPEESAVVAGVDVSFVSVGSEGVRYRALDSEDSEPTGPIELRPWASIGRIHVY